MPAYAVTLRVDGAIKTVPVSAASRPALREAVAVLYPGARVLPVTRRGPATRRGA